MQSSSPVSESKCQILRRDPASSPDPLGLRLVYLVERWEYAAVLGSLGAHLEIMVRFESNLANRTLGVALVAVPGCHHTYGERPALHKNDTRICPHRVQAPGFVSHLNARRQ